MSLPCCYTSEKNPFCSARRHGELPMCLWHIEKTIRRAILDDAIPADCFNELVQHTDNYLSIKRMANEFRVHEALTAGRIARDQESKRRQAEDCVVYYVQLTGQRIKIGWTTNLEARMKTFRARAADILAIEPGDYEVETRRHKQFAHLRIGRSEEFSSAPDLLAHIETLKVTA